MKKRDYINGAIGIASLIVMALSGSMVAAGETATLAYAPVGDVTYAPSGYEQFCRDHAEDCQDNGSDPRDIVLSKAAWRDLVALNDQVNRAIEPVTDLENYGKAEWWAYPANGKGDCEDYVLLKRRMLIERGWPESTLLITVVRDENNEGHAVLTVRTDIGDLVLDNKRQQIVRWTDTPYTFVKQQSERNPLVWSSLTPPNGDSSQTTASHSR